MLPIGNGFLVIYRNATTLVEVCVFFSLSLFEGKKKSHN